MKFELDVSYIMLIMFVGWGYLKLFIEFVMILDLIVV